MNKLYLKIIIIALATCLALSLYGCEDTSTVPQTHKESKKDDSKKKENSEDDSDIIISPSGTMVII